MKKDRGDHGPGAKYDASEVGGIINIEMARMGLEGYSLWEAGMITDLECGLNGMLKYGKCRCRLSCLIMTWGEEVGVS